MDIQLRLISAVLSKSFRNADERLCGTETKWFDGSKKAARYTGNASHWL